MTSIFQTFPILRQVAPRLSRQLFSCRSCHHRALRISSKKSNAPHPFLIKQSSYLKAFRSRIRSASITASSRRAEAVQLPSPLSSLNEARRSKGAGYFPEVSDKIVAYWLLGSAASVFGLVVFGGLTRLTESG